MTPNRNNPSAGSAPPAVRAIVLCFAALLAVLPAGAARRGRYRHWLRVRDDNNEKYMPVEVYKEMTVFERAAYDKALKLHREGQYRVAAAQFHKFVLQFEDSSGMAYAMLMEARCLHKDHKRVTGIKKYTEILDYFPESPSVAAPALYFRAVAKHENGDKLKGFRDYRLLVENPAYVKHDLGIPALLDLGDYYYEHEKQAQGVQYWQALLKRKIHRDLHRSLLTKIANWYVTTGNFSGYLRFRLGKEDIKDPKTYPAQLVVINKMMLATDAENAELVGKAYKFLQGKKGIYTASACLLNGSEAGKYSRGYYELGLRFGKSLDSGVFDRLAVAALQAFSSLTKGDQRYYQVGCGLSTLIGGTRGDKLNGEMVKQLSKEKDLAKYVNTACQVATQAGGRTRDILHKAIVTRTNAEPDDKTYLAITMPLNVEGKLLNSKAFKPMATQILGRISRQPAGKGRDDLLCRYIPGWSGYEAGYKILSRIGDVKRRFMLHLSMLSHEKKWPDYSDVLDEFEKNTPNTTEGIATKNWIRRQRAYVYHHKIRRYADAIKIYHAISDPPRTLWDIQDCYGRLRKWKEQLQVLSELETSFPKEAPRAAQAIAKVFQRQKMDKQAIAKCRSIMKVYREHEVSSWAHQELEKYGKATGGGLIDED
ncbi:MAG: hypothetical protein QGH60_05240 [Phycisphaerae bacterium]|nr:hypothetical protein [Phycisphaerae bacterium]